ncbi:MAG: DNA mismatch repair protein MutS [Clostridiales bacterium]|nr:DNA mismatch repair protein MutS [Clostridiales bacterium]
MALSPMMQQYFDIKEEYPNTILFFRLGDFYEMFFDDAKLVSKELELTLTGKDCGLEERAPMCGVPFHSADSYIAKLVSKGYKVAICEQIEDPATAKGLVKRGVIRIVTPGTVIESSMLDESKNNYLACVCVGEEQIGLCFIDVSTGAVHLTDISGENMEKRAVNEMGKYMPSEILLNSHASIMPEIKNFIAKSNDIIAEIIDDGEFKFENCERIVLDHFKKNSLEELSLDNNICICAVSALGVSLNYLKTAQKTELENIKEIDFYSDSQFMKLDFSARRNLELCETMRSREKRGTLLWVLDKTKTAMGKRLMRSWIEQPLINCAKIIKRHNAIDELFSKNIMLQDTIDLLNNVYDMERLMARISYSTANARELRSLCYTIAQLEPIREKIKDCKSNMLCEIYNDIDPLEDIRLLIDDAIVEEAPFSVREGGLIKEGFNEELDQMRDIIENGKDYIKKIEQEEQEKTGIKKLKIGYNKVFGYYIEVTNSFKELVPDEYIRKQTLTNCERYITQELKDLEAKVLGAHERSIQLEYQIFSEIRQKVADELNRIQRTASAVARLDVLCSLARVAINNNYTRPDIDNSDVIEIKDGRHPVVELMLDGAPFVPNDTLLDCNENRSAIITGPNMAGKSTFMRQVALIVLMAQIGSFVPAKYARVGIVDSIFTRVGASDDLASGQSTFMVEMSEVATILEQATSKSLIILDEIGRGTSTFDGMSIARAVLEYTADSKKLGAKTLFATHYHELTVLEDTMSGVKNYNIAVKKRGSEITFLRRIVRGGADGSYGIDVAKLAGVPNCVVTRAREVLKELESSEAPIHISAESSNKEAENDMQMSFMSDEHSEVIEKLKTIDVNTITPIEAMSTLYELVKKVK